MSHQKSVSIECRHLEKVYGKQSVLDDVNLRVESGTLCALVGPMGAGKTTLLKILASLITPTSGQAFLCGHDVLRFSHQSRRQIGFVSSQERSFYWRLSGRQNLKFFASLYGMDRHAIDRNIDAILRDVALEDKADVRVRKYSSGMRQVLGLVRGLIHDPSILLLDEPTRSLSPDGAKRIRILLKSKVITEKKTILMASHNLWEVEDLADKIAVLRRGKIVAEGTLRDLKTGAGLEETHDLDNIYDFYIRENRNRCD